MLRPRVIPSLLIHKNGLIKTVNFKDGKYVGDPINAVKIFNEKEADELIIVDIDASRYNLEPNFDLISKIAEECRMPLCYGGGIKSVEHAKKIINMGVEKIAISSAAIENAELISDIANAIGSQSVVAVIDYRKKTSFFNERNEICIHNATISKKFDILETVLNFEKMGAGEILLNSVNRDGKMQGYDLKLAKHIKNHINIPMTVLGGAGSLEHLKELFNEVGLVGAAAGSLFVFKGKYKAVLVNYPSPSTKFELCSNNLKI